MGPYLTAEEFAGRRNRLFELILNHGLTKLQNKVRLSSGIESDYYVDVKNVALKAVASQLIGDLFFDLICRFAPDITAVGGLTLGADPLVCAVTHASSRIYPLDGFLVRKEKKDHGLGNKIEGLRGIAPGSSVAIFEDVITTGESALTAIASARAADFLVDIILAVVDRQEGRRGEPTGIEKLRRQARTIALFTGQELLSGQCNSFYFGMYS